MSVLTKSVNEFNEETCQLIDKLNKSLTNNLLFIVQKHGINEMKTYDSRIVKNIMYSENFKCYLFFLNFNEVDRVTMVDRFDVIGNLN